MLLTNKHGPCPICEGTDRFRFDDKESRGTWICSYCGAGDGFDLLMKYQGWDFATAARAIDQMRGQDVPRETFKEEINVERRRTDLNGLWARAKSAENWLLHDYLCKQRGLAPVVMGHINDLRAIDQLDLWDSGERVGTYPAMLALIRNSKGQPISIHRTYIKPKSREKKMMPPIEKMAGGAIRLVSGVETLVVGEGIETTLAGWQYLYTDNRPTIGAWATISAGLLAEVKLPPTLKELWICVDNDESFTGQQYSYTLARRAKVQLGIPRVKLLMPNMQGCDVLDCLGQPDTIEVL
jgi:putative DNA primase/helicase